MLKLKIFGVLFVFCVLFQAATIGRAADTEYSPLVFQAVAQGDGHKIQRAANNINNAHLGDINATYRGWHGDIAVSKTSQMISIILRWISNYPAAPFAIQMILTGKMVWEMWQMCGPFPLLALLMVASPRRFQS